MRVARLLRRLSLLGGFLGAGYRLWYELAVVEANPYYVPPAGYSDTFAHAMWINAGDLTLVCVAYFVVVWLPLQIASRVIAGFVAYRSGRETL